MNKLVKNLSPTVEMVLILIIGLGWFVYSSTNSFLIVNSDYEQSWEYSLTNQWHFTLVIYEIFALLIIIYILRVRDWKIEDFNLTFSFRMILTAILIIFSRNIISNTGFKVFEFFQIVDEETVSHIQFGLKANWLSIILVIIINSIYEEFILIGYLFKRLEKYHPVIIIGFSLLIRQLFHTYQGWLTLFIIIPTGLVFGIYYYKYRKLWPVIIAHGLSNLIVFLGMHFEWYEKINKLGDSLQ